jgi:GWxTD domain-containing protein
VKKTVLAAFGLAIAALATAQLSKYKDWAKSPEAYFLTPEERAEWSKLTSDADAEKFIDAYYAKRGGQRFKEEVARRIAAADEQFKLRHERGAESARGRLLVTLGGPSRVTQTRSMSDAGVAGDSGRGAIEGTDSFGSATGAAVGPMVQTWIYDKNKFDPSWDIGELKLQVVVDSQKGMDQLRNAAAADQAIAKIAARSIVNPSAAGAPAAGAAGAASPAPAAGGAAPAPAAASGSAPAAAVPPPPAAAASLPAATRASLEAVQKTGKSSPGFWGGSFHAVSGDPFYALAFYFEGGQAPAGGSKFAGVVTSQSGGEAATFWEDATLSDMKTGAQADKVFEKSIVLPAGSYRGAFAIYSADGASALQTASVNFTLEPKSTDFGVSPLILTNELKPLTKRPAETDPFVFGVTKPIKVEPKADRVFSKQDSLWYFYEVSNPKLSEPAAAPTPAPAATPGAAVTPAAAEPKPRIMQRISVLRDGKPAFAPFTGPAEMQILAPGYYASGSEIPLATFEPGFYTFQVNVRDLNASRDSAGFKGIDRQEEFIVLKPDGTVPERAASKAAAPTPRPKKP